MDKHSTIEVSCDKRLRGVGNATLFVERKQHRKDKSCSEDAMGPRRQRIVRHVAGAATEALVHFNGVYFSNDPVVAMEAKCKRELLEHNEFRFLKIDGKVKILMSLKGQEHSLNKERNT